MPTFADSIPMSRVDADIREDTRRWHVDHVRTYTADLKRSRNPKVIKELEANIRRHRRALGVLMADPNIIFVFHSDMKPTPTPTPTPTR